MYDSVMVKVREEQSERELETAMRKVADQPHAPWINIAACRECSRELADSITYSLDRLQGKTRTLPTECRARIEAQEKLGPEYH